MAFKLLWMNSTKTNPAIIQELGDIPMTLCDQDTALEDMHTALSGPSERPRSVCFLNANVFLKAHESSECKRLLRTATAVYPDGVALRMGARSVGVSIPKNLPGTDLVPALLRKSTGGGCFLVGSHCKELTRVAQGFKKAHPNWSIVGSHHGFFSEEQRSSVVAKINEAAPDLLLVGMGSPAQEEFLQQSLTELRVPLAVCVGGLFSYWSGELTRAPVFVRTINLEWAWILAQQPSKWRRYSLGVAQFFMNLSQLNNAQLEETIQQ